ncbi:hypothetical protein FF38_12730 [Lucilia cuprina]|uniref:Uncharacterized protein n=1 Tax=Lucilia cuprina TaxID=7375 RepID=A0A0L0CP34_LUCCU|nr:hypothetical protein FF38_12730 [Lucilia cuprina]
MKKEFFISPIKLISFTNTQNTSVRNKTLKAKLNTVTINIKGRFNMVLNLHIFFWKCISTQLWSLQRDISIYFVDCISLWA